MTNEPEFPRLARVGKSYRSIAVLFFNTVIFFVLLNLVAYPFVLILGRGEMAGSLSYGMEKLRQVYPGYSVDEIEQLLEETWSRQYIYEPFTQFKEGLIEGTYVNTDKAGFRLIAEQAVWPVNEDAFNIFVFGGSTTFGYGVADGDTIPSYLQAALRSEGGCDRPLNVYNFGRANYYSTQERILFEQMLASGVEPDMALFVDGLNEFIHPDNEPKFTGQLQYLMVESDGQLVWRAVKTMPLLQLPKIILGRFEDAAESTAAVEAVPTEVSEAIIDHYLVNKRLIENVAGLYDVESFFVWQPVPTYEYDLAYHVFYEGDEAEFKRHIASQDGYRLMAERVEAGDEALDGADFLWLADIQIDRTEPLYVDQVHYSAEFSRIIADAMADFVGGHCS